MGVLDDGGDRQRRRDSFVGEFGASPPSRCKWEVCDAVFPNYFGQDLLRV